MLIYKVENIRIINICIYISEKNVQFSWCIYKLKGWMTNISISVKLLGPLKYAGEIAAWHFPIREYHFKSISVLICQKMNNKRWQEMYD